MSYRSTKSLLLPTLLAFSAPMAWAGPAVADPAAQWLKPVIGVHRLNGERGCERVEIKQWSADRTKLTVDAGTHEVVLYNASNPDFIWFKKDETRDIFKYQHTEDSNSWGLGDLHRETARLEKNRQGEIVKVTLVQEEGSYLLLGMFPSWNTISVLRCQR